MPVHVRPATDADMAAIFEVRTAVRQNHLSLEQLAERGITPDSVREMMRGTMGAWVAEEEGEVTAFAMADSATASVWAMFVRPQWEGRGAGRALMREAESWLFAQGCDEIWLRTDQDPAVRANGFYGRLGWTNLGPQDDGQNEYRKRADGSRP